MAGVTVLVSGGLPLKTVGSIPLSRLNSASDVSPAFVVAVVVPSASILISTGFMREKIRIPCKRDAERHSNAHAQRAP